MSNIDSTSSELDYTIQKWEKAGHIPSLMSAVVNYWLRNRCCGVIHGGCAVNWNLKTADRRPCEWCGLRHVWPDQSEQNGFVRRGALKPMCLFNVIAWKPVFVYTQINSMNLEMCIECLLDIESVIDSWAPCCLIWWFHGFMRQWTSNYCLFQGDLQWLQNLNKPLYFEHEQVTNGRAEVSCSGCLKNVEYYSHILSRQILQL